MFDRKKPEGVERERFPLSFFLTLKTQFVFNYSEIFRSPSSDKSSSGKSLHHTDSQCLNLDDLIFIGLWGNKFWIWFGQRLVNSQFSRINNSNNISMFLVLSIMCFWPSTKRRINVNLRLYILSYRVALSFVGYIGIICILYWINLHQLSYHLSLLIRVRINLGQQTTQSFFHYKT